MEVNTLQRIVERGERLKRVPLGDFSHCYAHPHRPNKYFLYGTRVGFSPPLDFNREEYKLIGGRWSRDGVHFVTFSRAPDHERFFYIHVFEATGRKLVGYEMLWLTSSQGLLWVMDGQYLMMRAIDQIRIYRLVPVEEDATLRLYQIHQITIFAGTRVSALWIASDGYYHFTQTNLMEGEEFPNAVDEIVIGCITEKAEDWSEERNLFVARTFTVPATEIVSQVGLAGMVVASFSGNLHIYVSMRVVRLSLEGGRTTADIEEIARNLMMEKTMRRFPIRENFEARRLLVDTVWKLSLEQFHLGERFILHPEEQFAMHILPSIYHPCGDIEYTHQVIQVACGTTVHEARGAIGQDQEYVEPVLDRHGNVHCIDFGEDGLKMRSFYVPVLRARAEDYMVQLLVQKMTGRKIPVL